MDVMEALRTRRSVRKYKADPVSREQLEQIVDAGRLAASARNVQPWEFVVVTNQGTRSQIAAMVENGSFIADAPACIVVLSKPTRYFLEDGSAATENMLVAACGLGLGTCWVAGDKKPYAAKIVELLGAPDDYLLISHIAVGYPENIPAPEKRALADVLHWEQF